jgi:hypothetical protein
MQVHVPAQSLRRGEPVLAEGALVVRLPAAPASTPLPQVSAAAASSPVARLDLLLLLPPRSIAMYEAGMF